MGGSTTGATGTEDDRGRGAGEGEGIGSRAKEAPEGGANKGQAGVPWGKTPRPNRPKFWRPCALGKPAHGRRKPRQRKPATKPHAAQKKSPNMSVQQVRSVEGDPGAVN